MGKTALVEMLSKLWNQSLLNQWRRQKDQILDFMRRKLGDLTMDETVDDYMVFYIVQVGNVYTSSHSIGILYSYVSVHAYAYT